MVSQFAQNEQNMNAVERVLYYTELEPEGEATTPKDPPPSWPSEGGIIFKNVELAYREGLPLVLKDVSFEIKPGEKASLSNCSRFPRVVLRFLSRLVSLAVQARGRVLYYKHCSGT